MKVLFLTHSYPRAEGDAPGNFLLQLAVALRAEDVEVRVLAPSGDHLPADDVIQGIPVHRFRYAPRRFQTLAYTGQMAEEVSRKLSAKLALLGFLGSGFTSGTIVRREFEPELVHAHWWFPGGLVGTWIAGLAGLPLVTTMHGSDVRLARASGIGRSGLRRVLAQSSASTTVSRWLADQVRAMAPEAQPVVAPMPVSTSMFGPGDARHARRFLFVGRLNAQKGIELLLQAFATLDHDVELDVVGDGTAREAMAQRAAELGIAERVHWQGALPQPALVEFYQRATALVVPSQDEGYGLVAVEAQLCETPVVAFASGGLVDIVDDGVTGFLAPAGDVTALADRMRSLLHDAPAAAAIGRAGRQSALARVSPESVARRYAQIYRSVIASREA